MTYKRMRLGLASLALFILAALTGTGQLATQGSIAGTADWRRF